jgi:hypothetical protein
VKNSRWKGASPLGVRSHTTVVLDGHYTASPISTGKPQCSRRPPPFHYFFQLGQSTILRAALDEAPAE